MPTTRKIRLERLRKAMGTAGVEALVVTHLPNVYYLCGFTGSSGVLLVLGDAAHLFTDGRYTIQAKDESPEARTHIVRGALAGVVGEFLSGRGKRRMALRAGFDGMHLSVTEWTKLKSAAGAGVRWKSASGMVEGLREIKDAEELAIMRRAAKLGSEVMTEVIGLVRPGVTEIELAAEIDYRMRRKGAEGTSFESIVAGGSRSALPHARPTARALGKNELVVLDLGAILGHYCSDLTRTVYLGRAPKKIRNWYLAVERAQQEALKALQAGVESGEVDRAARWSLERDKLGKYFVHSTGHGLGIEVHETPRLGKGQTQRIQPESVVTLEPGIYVQGVGGIRIEDDVAVHAGGTEVLTSAPTGFLEI